MNKAQAVIRIEEIKDVFGKMKAGSGFTKDGKHIDLCGILFYKEWGYCTNNHFLIRVHVPDREGEEPIYYNFENNEENNIEQENKLHLVGQDTRKDSSQKLIFYNYEESKHIEMFKDSDWEQYIKQLNNKFNIWNSGFISVNSEHLLNILDLTYGKKVNDKKSNTIRFHMANGCLDVEIYKINDKELNPKCSVELSDTQYKISSTSLSAEDDDKSIYLNVMYLYSCLNILKNNPYINIHFSNVSPVLIESKTEESIKIVLAQCLPKSL